MPKNPDLRPLLGAVQPEEAMAFFKAKGFKTGFDYRDVWQQEHAHSFTVAKAMQLDVLRDIRAAVDKALDEGGTLAEFGKTLTPKLQAAGWWGKKEMVDPLTGELKMVQLGSPRRLQTIFDTNLATAYSEGQWERIQRNKAIFPFLEYVRSGSLNPRHTHLAYAGLVLPADDAFWQTHYPIKEYNCKCTVIQHTARMLAREGLAVGTAPPEVMRTVVNKRTGETMEVPTGVHPAFHYPPGGRAGHLDKMLADKRAEQPGVVLAAGVVIHRTGSRLPSAQPLSERRREAGLAAQAMWDAPKTAAAHRMGLVRPEVAAQVRRMTGVDVRGYALMFDSSAVAHVRKKHTDARLEASKGARQVPMSAADFEHLPQLLDAPSEVREPQLTPMGIMALEFVGLAGGAEYSVVIEIRKRAKSMALKTMYKRRVRPPEA